MTFTRFTTAMPRLLFRVLLLFSLSIPLLCRADDYLPRTWTNSLGVKMEATFVRMEDGKITLLMNSGQMVTMPIDKFSPGDQEYVRGLQSRLAATPAPSAPATGGAPGVNPAPPGDVQPGTSQSTGANAQKKSILLRPAIIHAPDPRVQPKAEIYVPFPELGKSRTGDPMGMRIRIPSSYKPDHPVPLLLWLAPGDGNDRFNAAMDLVNPEDFVLVGMNYPAEPVPAPQYAAKAGHIEQVWDFEEKMIAKLQDMIPNIDPRLRVVAGFSNGAHTIGGCLAHKIEGIEYFNVYILIDGGISDKYEYPTLPGRYYYVAWGEEKLGGRGIEFGQMLETQATQAGMKVEAHPMPGIGHDFPDFEKAKVKAWLNDVVIPAQLSKPLP